jgi:hypothetical protein
MLTFYLRGLTTDGAIQTASDDNPSDCLLSFGKVILHTLHRQGGTLLQPTPRFGRKREFRRRLLVASDSGRW